MVFEMICLLDIIYLKYLFYLPKSLSFKFDFIRIYYLPFSN